VVLTASEIILFRSTVVVVVLIGDSI